MFYTYPSQIIGCIKPESNFDYSSASMRENSSITARLPWILSTIGFMGVFATILWFAYHGTLHPFFTQNDKLAHFILYGTASFLGHRATNRRHLQQLGYPIPLFPVLFTLFTLGEELVQQFSPNRTLDLMDLLASFAGIAVGYWLAERHWVPLSK
jgi:VanZ family protein